MDAEHPAGLLTMITIRAMPAGASVSAGDVSPVATGWSWMHRLVGTGVRFRTTVTETATVGMPLGPEMQSGFWCKQIEVLQVGKVPTIATGYCSDASVLWYGDPDPSIANLYQRDPGRLPILATLTPGATWTMAGQWRRVAGLADVDLQRFNFPDCVIVEMGPHGQAPTWRSATEPAMSSKGVGI